MKSPDAVADEFARVPAMRQFGMRLEHFAEGTAELSLPVDAGYHQLGDVVHGGVIATLADTAAVYAVWPSLEDERMMTSIEFKLNFLRPARGSDGPLVARSRAVSRGRRIAVCDVEVVQAGGAVARGLFTYLLFERT